MQSEYLSENVGETRSPGPDERVPRRRRPADGRQARGLRAAAAAAARNPRDDDAVAEKKRQDQGAGGPAEPDQARRRREGGLVGAADARHAADARQVDRALESRHRARAEDVGGAGRARPRQDARAVGHRVPKLEGHRIRRRGRSGGAGGLARARAQVGPRDGRRPAGPGGIPSRRSARELPGAFKMLGAPRGADARPDRESARIEIRVRSRAGSDEIFEKPERVLRKEDVVVLLNTTGSGRARRWAVTVWAGGGASLIVRGLGGSMAAKLVNLLDVHAPFPAAPKSETSRFGRRRLRGSSASRPPRRLRVVSTSRPPRRRDPPPRKTKERVETGTAASRARTSSRAARRRRSRSPRAPSASTRARTRCSRSTTSARGRRSSGASRTASSSASRHRPRLSSARAFLCWTRATSRPAARPRRSRGPARRRAAPGPRGNRPLGRARISPAGRPGAVPRAVV